jgi:hypothetical protein
MWKGSAREECTRDCFHVLQILSCGTLWPQISYRSHRSHPVHSTLFLRAIPGGHSISERPCNLAFSKHPTICGPGCNYLFSSLSSQPSQVQDRYLRASILLSALHCTHSNHDQLIAAEQHHVGRQPQGSAAKFRVTTPAHLT